MENVETCFSLVELVHPVRFKRDGVDDNEFGFITDICWRKELLNQSITPAINDFVDSPSCFGRALHEVAVVKRCPVKVLRFILIFLSNIVVLILVRDEEIVGTVKSLRGGGIIYSVC